MWIVMVIYRGSWGESGSDKMGLFVKKDVKNKKKGGLGWGLYELMFKHI